MINNNKISKHLIEYFLPFYYMLSLYSDVLYIGVGNILLILIALTYINNGKVVIKKHVRIYIPFLLYVIIRDFSKVVFTKSLSPGYNAVETLILFFAFFLVESGDFDENRLYQSWKAAGFLYSLGLIYHLFQLLILHRAINPISIIPGVPLGGTNVYLYRPCSFFPEPAAFASAMLPLVFLAIKRKNYLMAMIASVMILASTSTVGMVLLIVLWFYAMTVSNIRTRTKVLIGLALIGVMGYLMASPIFEEAFSKFEGVIAGESTFGTRIIVGFSIIKTMDVSQWICGTNTLNVKDYVSQHFSQFPASSPVILYYRADKLFLNSFTFLIYHYGIVGLLLYSTTIWKRFRKTTYAAKPLLLLHAISLFGQSTVLNTLFYQMIILLSFYDSTGSLQKNDLKGK